MQIRFDHGPSGSACEFHAPKRLVVAETARDLMPALRSLDEARQAGHWVAGYITYEAGYALEPKLHALMPQNRRLPLLQMGVYDHPQAASELTTGPVSVTKPVPLWSLETYSAAFERIHNYICAGDIYQANLTFPLEARATGEAEALYTALVARQPVRFGAFIQQDGLPTILSRSPERFFSTDENGVIETRPMKGTQPRSDDPEIDERRRVFLLNDPKNRAENLMIVDLLRNDISRVSRAGSVHVPKLYEVESYQTVHQMTSIVRASLRRGVGLSEIMEALFPCGSITGAPKIRAMEIIAELESGPRDIYCGAIGWAAPDGRSDFNVAIRTLMLEHGAIRLNVGGGVVYDSTAQGEYEEALWKTRFLNV